MKLRGKNPNCKGCGGNADIRDLSSDYQLWCGSAANDKPLNINDDAAVQQSDDFHITCKEFHSQVLCGNNPFLLVDVRESVQYEICSLKPSINIPLQRLQENIEKLREMAFQNPISTVYLLCRRGIDSAVATKVLRSAGFRAQNIKGGLVQWTQTVDVSFPTY